MATASTAGAWHSGGRPERPYPARAPRPTAGAERPGRPARQGAPARGPAAEGFRAAEREFPQDRFDQPYPVPRRPAGARPAEARGRERTSASGARESRLRGAVAVLGVFLLTLAGCAVDSFVGTGLGTITLVTLAAGTAIATWLVRRRDLLTVIVAPPLVFVLVAMANISLAPSATVNLPTMATLLVRGFPTMAVATAIAVVLGLVRLAGRR
ncbi:DUF6542 domain-containing protein [Blastococcus saxobsidens]|uniref:DUF6542 domain-containing protein n=1 Tax=Blastococcus saxobsidens (strain DD2) TaxID=1146883 RepID=H6RTH0_BLASD|nr:DUF6542 domain-containing protein [Blastococcus saxobsidens]CCG01828.1 conserved membrane protein of unknown function [Blastococcus saxobsidens DD2]